MPIRIVLPVIAVIGFIFLLFFPTIQKFNLINNRIFQSCQFVRNHLFPIEKDLDAWLRSCRIQSRPYSFQKANVDVLLEKGNQILSELNVSHLELFNEKENQAIWTDVDVENGIESKFIDGELIITRVFPNGEGKKKGLQRGDRVVLKSDESISPFALNKWKGRITVESKKIVKTVELTPSTLSIPREISLTELARVKVIAVESFKSQYFSEEKLNAVFSKIKKTDKLIIDLRGNNGGNFVAGLKLLSPFFCTPTLIGHLKKNKSVGEVGFFQEDLDDESQIQLLNQVDSVGLKTFDSKFCLPKPKVILIDASSKSTTEWVALAFRELLGVPIRGAASAGELLVAIWFDISSIWRSVVKISIPVASYESINGKQVEGQGVRVDENIYPRRTDLERGYDSEVWQTVLSIK